MDKLLQTKYENLIIEEITQNERYKGNEDLLKFIYEDVVARLGNILDNITDETVVKSYIDRIVKLSVITTIKKRSILLSAPLDSVTEKSKADYSNYYNVFNYTPSGKSNINLDSSLTEKLKSELQVLADQYPQKEYIKLYNLRYIENKSLVTISVELNIYQSQAADRIYELTALSNRIFGNVVS